MPLAVYKGGLIVKVEIDENGNEVRKLCTTCCDTAPPDPIGCCYTYSYDNAGDPIFIVTKDTESNCEEIQQQVDPSFEVVWEELDNPDAECPETPNRSNPLP